MNCGSKKMAKGGMTKMAKGGKVKMPKEEMGKPGKTKIRGTGAAKKGVYARGPMA